MEWEYEEINSDQIKRISQICDISFELAEILYKRGLKEENEIEKLNRRLDDKYQFYLF